MKKNCLSKGAVLIREGTTDRSVYLLVSGRMLAWTEHNGKKYSIGEIRPGDVVGELGFLDGKPRCASVTALTDCVVTELAHAEVQPGHEDYQKALQLLVGHLVRRLRSANQRVLELNVSLEHLKKISSGRESTLVRERVLVLLRLVEFVERFGRLQSERSADDFSDLVREMKIWISGEKCAFSCDRVVDALRLVGVFTQISEENVIVRLDLNQCAQLSKGLLEISRFSSCQLSLEAIEVLTLLLKAKHLFATEGDEVVEVLVSDLLATSSHSQRELVWAGLRDLSDSKWITLQSDLQVFRGNYQSMLRLNQALVFFNAVAGEQLLSRALRTGIESAKRAA